MKIAIGTMLALFAGLACATGGPLQTATITSYNISLPMHELTEAMQWNVINDTVMGGRSSADIEVSEDGLMFTGLLSLENNGGFASIRRFGEPVKWQTGKPLSITAMGDGRDYQFRLRTTRGWDGVAYAAGFKTIAGQRTTIRFWEDDFTPVWRGRLVRGAPPLSFDDVAQLGFMLADKNPGSFALTINNIQQ